MNILVIGGTRYFGIPTVEELLENGHKVTVATRGITPDPFGNRVSRLILNRTDHESLKAVLSGRHFDVVIDKRGYSSNDIRILLDVLDCDKYIYMSTTAVYEPKRDNTREEDFDPFAGELVWCSWGDYPYDVIKRHAERALWRNYGDRKFIAVRYPFVVCENDYTRRLRFYVEHVLNGIPMYIDNLDCPMGFIHSKEAGEFMAYLCDTDFTGAVNGCSAGAISMGEVIRYVEEKTGQKAVLSADGDPAPYNGEPAYTINTDKAASLGYRFSDLNDWIYDLLDEYMK